MEQLMLKELIDSLQKAYNEYGDIPVYYRDDGWLEKADYRFANVSKFYYYRREDEDFLEDDDINLVCDDVATDNDSLTYPIDSDKPVFTAMLFN